MLRPENGSTGTGYTALLDVLSGEQVEAVRARLAELLAAEGERAGLEVHRERGTDRLSDLVNKRPVFEPCFTDSRVLPPSRRSPGGLPSPSSSTHAPRRGCLRR
jgi:hypothetical protein